MDHLKVLELAAHIEAAPHRKDRDIRFGTTGDRLQPTHFNMRHWHCGTCACIGGHAEAMFGHPDALELDSDQEDELFYPSNPPLKYDEIQPADAAKVLRHLAETGEVDWSIIVEL
jgi:hypothetical protein